MELLSPRPKRRLSYDSDDLDWKNEIVQVINEAQAYAENNDMNKAWELAETVIKMNPQSLEAFLVRGELYYQQGHYNVAMDIFDQGTKSMDRENEKQILREKYQAVSDHAFQVIKNEKDFIVILPSEISIIIFENFGIEEQTIFNCTFVSKRWRKFILTMCSAGWKSARWDGSGPASPAFIMLEEVASRVTCIESFNWMSNKIKSKYRAILKNANLDRVRKLKTDSINMDLIFPKVAQNLTTLILAIDYNPLKSFQPLDVEQILNDCPNIIHLEFDRATTRSENADKKDYQYNLHIIKSFSDSAKAIYSNLKSIIVHGHPLDPAIAGAIFERSPNLQVFGTSTSSDPSGRRDHHNAIRDTMERLEQHCLPRLETLLALPYNTKEFEPLIKKLINQQYQQQEANTRITKGIKHIVVAPGKGGDFDYLTPFINHSRDTLEELTFDLNNFLNINNDEYRAQIPTCVARWGDFFNNMPYPFTKLKTIQYKRRYVRTLNFDMIFVQLIEKTPELQSITLEGIGFFSGLIVDALRTLHSLQKLKLIRCSLSPKLLSWFKQYVTSRNEISLSLKHIELISCNGFKRIKIWKPLSNIRNLDFVKITDCKMKRDEVQKFVYQYCQHSDAKNICLKDLEFVSDDEVKELLKRQGDMELDRKDDFHLYNTYEYPHGWVEFEDDAALEGYDQHTGRYRLV